MNKQKELAKNTAILTIGKLSTQVVSFLLLPLYTSILSPEENGIVDLVLTYSTLLLPFITLAIEQAVFRFLIDVREDKKNKIELISTVINFTLLQNIVIVFVFTIIAIFIRKQIFIYFMFVLLAFVWSTVLLQISRGLGDNFGYALGSTMSAISQVVSNVVFLCFLNFGPEGMMISMIIGNILCSLIVVFHTKIFDYYKFVIPSNVVVKQLLSYSLPMIPNQLSWWALNASNKIIVQFFINVAGNGLIAVANKFSSVYIQFSTIFNVSWTESATLHYNEKDSDSFFSQTINMVYKLFMCACCGIIVCVGICFKWLINVQYSDSYGLIPIFMIASLFNVIVSLYGVIYVAQKKTIEIAKTSGYAALINIATHLLLIKSMGIYASAISTLVGYASMAIYRYYHSRKYITIKLSISSIMGTALLLSVSMLSYYSKNLLLLLIALILIIICSVYLNSGIILTILNSLKRKFLKE